mgnify:CR=1 FL=1
MNSLAQFFVVLLAAIAVTGCSRSDPTAEPVRTGQTTAVNPGSVAGNNEFAGEIRARTETRLAFRVTGKLAERSVDIGARVKAGQIVARLDPADLNLAQESTRAAVRSAEVALQLAQADYSRFKDLRDQGFISAAELERDAGLKSAAANLEQARAQAGLQANQARYSALMAASNGVVVGVDAEVGAVLAAGAPVVRIAVDGPRDVAFSVPEDLVQRFRAVDGRSGAIAVKVWGRASPQVATLREVGAAADPVTRTFLLKAELDASSAELGQTATVALPVERTDNVIRLPLSAVMETKGRSSVWVYDAATSTVKSRAIVLAGVDGNQVIVSSGLVKDDVVVTAGVHVLTEGQQVKLMAAASVTAETAPSRPISGPAR